MKTSKELKEWLKLNPWPDNASHKQSLEWHMKAIEFEFGENSYVIVTTSELENAWWSS